MWRFCASTTSFVRPILRASIISPLTPCCQCQAIAHASSPLTRPLSARSFPSMAYQMVIPVAWPLNPTMMSRHSSITCHCFGLVLISRSWAS
ncbi:hypothetical protein BC940DRAFT_300927 [Gongronella butleri]|nr:hypothetical protein BC940DRAFT_300927 [Gongronella butleri]